MSEKEIKEMFKMSPGAILENYKFMQKELEQLDKYKIVLDKIKELAKENINNSFMRPEIEETTMTFKNALALDILELLEEIE